MSSFVQWRQFPGENESHARSIMNSTWSYCGLRGMPDARLASAIPKCPYCVEAIRRRIEQWEDRATASNNEREIAAIVDLLNKLSAAIGGT